MGLLVLLCSAWCGAQLVYGLPSCAEKGPSTGAIALRTGLYCPVKKQLLDRSHLNLARACGSYQPAFKVYAPADGRVHDRPSCIFCQHSEEASRAREVLP
jgi:hypothetical protein